MSPIPLSGLSAAARVPRPGADGQSWDLMVFDGSQWILKDFIRRIVGINWASARKATLDAHRAERRSFKFSILIQISMAQGALLRETARTPCGFHDTKASVA